jgi:hypothetical protein
MLYTFRYLFIALFLLPPSALPSLALGPISATEQVAALINKHLENSALNSKDLEQTLRLLNKLDNQARADVYQQIDSLLTQKTQDAQAAFANSYTHNLPTLIVLREQVIASTLKTSAILIPILLSGMLAGMAAGGTAGWKIGKTLQPSSQTTARVGIYLGIELGCLAGSALGTAIALISAKRPLKATFSALTQLGIKSSEMQPLYNRYLALLQLQKALAR